MKKCSPHYSQLSSKKLLFAGNGVNLLYELCKEEERASEESRGKMERTQITIDTLTSYTVCKMYGPSFVK